jgi:HAD superfamily phosphatase (TIGR01668 family)
MGMMMNFLLMPTKITCLTDLSPDALAVDVRGIILDLDNTVIGYGCNDIPPDVVAWVAQARARGFKMVLLSNNFTERARRVSEELGVPAIAGALKPLPMGFLRALAILGTSKEQTIVVGDQLFTDVLGANLVGIRAILTRPIAPRDWLGTRVLRFFERLVLGAR